MGCCVDSAYLSSQLLRAGDCLASSFLVPCCYLIGLTLILYLTVLSVCLPPHPLKIISGLVFEITITVFLGFFFPPNLNLCNLYLFSFDCWEDITTQWYNYSFLRKLMFWDMLSVIPKHTVLGRGGSGCRLLSEQQKLFYTS